MKSSLSPAPVSLAEIEAARRRLARGLRLTPCPFAPALSDLVGMQIWLKREDLQRTGSFKERGARNALLCIPEADRARGVIAASAGNHALGLAYHGAQLGIPVTVVVPASARPVKVDRCRALGAQVVVHGGGFDAAQAHAAELAGATRATLVHPFDDARVIAGQGTMALEFLQQVPKVDTVAVAVGGGGMLAGIAVAVKALRPNVRVVAVEPENAAKFLAAEICREPTTAAVLPTLADGLAVARIGRLNFATAARLIDDVVTVTEAEIATAIAVLARTCGVVAEGAGATALAAVIAGKVRAQALVAPVSGRNIDAQVHRRILADEPVLARPHPIAWAA
jgi:threonine dehydratase